MRCDVCIVRYEVNRVIFHLGACDNLPAASLNQPTRQTHFFLKQRSPNTHAKRVFFTCSSLSFATSTTQVCSASHARINFSFLIESSTHTFSLSLPATVSALFSNPTTNPPPLFPAAEAAAGAASPQPSHSACESSFSYLARKNNERSGTG